MKVWKDNPEFKVGDWTFKTAPAALQKLDDGIKTIAAKEDELKDLQNDCDDAAKEINALRTRALSATRGQFGPDSSEYERAGGTRSSERKRPARKDAGKKTEPAK